MPLCTPGECEGDWMNGCQETLSTDRHTEILLDK